ncbi:MAG: hypothetical protein ACI9OJ_005046, partial [Myxococcota bacterium]
RLSFFLWNSVPDDTLLDAAASGGLDTQEGIDAQAARMLADSRNKRAVRNFFSEWLHLKELEEMTKDPNIFRHYAPGLGESAAEETLQLVEHLVFDKNADIREFFTTRTAFVDRRLAAIYNVAATAEEGFGKIELPADQPRRGFLGQVAFLAAHSHPVSSSATLRGLFIRESLLCETQPEAPAGLNTAIPEPAEGARTLKERLIVHMEEPFCASCHQYTDLLGLGLENFDGIGRHRLTDNDAIIDASGALDDIQFDGPSELSEVIANDPRMPACIVQRLYSYGTGRPIAKSEWDEVGSLTEGFEASGRRFKSLMLKVATSPGFRTVGEVE